MAKGSVLRFELDDEDLKLFTEEAEEQLALLDGALVQLEGEPDPGLLQEIFRAAHTLKGSSATIGHKKMAALTHAMETVLDAIRQGRRTPDSAVVDVLLESLDALKVLAHEVVTRVDAGIDTEPLEQGLFATLEGSDEGAITGSQPLTLSGDRMPDTAREALAHPEDALRVVAEIEPNCELPGIRCFQLVQELDQLAEILHLVPARDVVESGGGEYRLEAVVAAVTDTDELRRVLLEVPDIASVDVAPAATAEPAAPLAQAKPPRKVRNRKAEQPPPAPTASASRKGASQSVRIDVERLDGLMNLVGELVIDRTRLEQIKDQLAGVLKSAQLTELTENLEETTAHLARITDELQDEIMRSRMLPVRSVLRRLPRLVRDVANKCGKKVDLVTAGEETELDRSVIEEISDPLVHILRNAVDHGIELPAERLAAGKPEAGQVTVTAWNQETFIYLSVKDDGKGIDTRRLREKVVERGLMTREMAEAASEEAAVEFIFLPGLSTADEVSDVSGRGVGMDIVRTNIERLNGRVTVRSVLGEGSEFIIQLPLTLATTKALMVQANGTVYALPLVSVTEALGADDAEIHVVGGRKTLRLREQLLPVLELAGALGDERPVSHTGPRFVVAARHGDRQVALMVDRLLGEQDVVVKTLGDLVGTRRGLTGATILGDGTLGLIIDVAGLMVDDSTQRSAA